MKKVKIFDAPFGNICKNLSKENGDLKTRLKIAIEENKRLKKELEFYKSDTMRSLTRQNETLEADLDKLTKQSVFLGLTNEFEGER